VNIHCRALEQRREIARRKEEAVPFVPPEWLELELNDAQKQAAQSN